jgi:hypothetical protein
MQNQIYFKPSHLWKGKLTYYNQDIPFDQCFPCEITDIRTDKNIVEIVFLGGDRACHWVSIEKICDKLDGIPHRISFHKTNSKINEILPFE